MAIVHNFVSYDAFPGSTIDSAKWTIVSGAVTNPSNNMRIGTDPNGGGNAVVTSVLASRVGWQFDWAVINRGSGGNPALEIEVRTADASKRIRLVHALGVNQFDILTTGFAGESALSITVYGTIKIQQEGADILVYTGGTLRLTIPNQTMPDMIIRGLSNSGTNQEHTIDNVFIAYPTGGAFPLLLD